jgi:Fe2+-dicitrate sensor, membrane component
MAMKNKELLDRFDSVMAKLKAVEPSSAFDLEFKRRLNEAVAETYEETALQKLAKRMADVLDGLLYVIMPPRPVLVRVLATILVTTSVGLYFGITWPSSPVLVAKEGIVLMQGQGAKNTGGNPMRLAQAIRPGDLITTGKASQLDIELSGKYSIRIKECSKVRIAKITPRYGNGKAIFDVLEGKVLVNISEGFKGSKFVVSTRAGTATALGTKFSVDVSKDESKEIVSVLEGKVKVESSYKPKKLMLAKSTVIVNAGQKSEVSVGSLPLTPQRLIEKEWLELEELYQIGRKSQVILLIKNTSDRARQLLAPCPIYISGEEPKEIPALVEEAVLKIAQAVKAADNAKHLESIKMLEKMLAEHPDPKYDVQFLLYIGAYYEYIGDHEGAINTFKKVLTRYPDSILASIAQCAIGIIYEEKLQDMDRANEAFDKVLKHYPNSLEAIFAEEKLGVKIVT